jgi:hypothetical protein
MKRMKYPQKGKVKIQKKLMIQIWKRKLHISVDIAKKYSKKSYSPKLAAQMDWDVKIVCKQNKSFLLDFDPMLEFEIQSLIQIL